jgi:hypothetical protein
VSDQFWDNCDNRVLQSYKETVDCWDCNPDNDTTLLVGIAKLNLVYKACDHADFDTVLLFLRRYAACDTWWDSYDGLKPLVTFQRPLCGRRVQGW